MKNLLLLTALLLSAVLVPAQEASIQVGEVEQDDWLMDTTRAADWRTTIGSSLYFDLAFVSNRSDYANQEVRSRNMLGTLAFPDFQLSKPGDSNPQA